MLSRRDVLSTALAATAAGGLSALLGGCSPDDDPMMLQAPTPADPRPVVAACTGMLLSRLVTGDKNVVLSPYSILHALAMVRSGAQGQIAAELDTLFDATGRQEWERWWPSMTCTILGHNGVFREDDIKLKVDSKIANAAFTHTAIDLLPEYREQVRSIYGAEVKTVNFDKTAEAARMINSWVKRHTGGQIDQVVQADMLAAIRLVLVNTIHLIANWATRFEKESTTEDEFHRADGQSVRVAMMHGATHGYASDDHQEATRLAMAGDGLAMALALPKESIEDMVAHWSRGGLDEMIQAFDTDKVLIDLPRWSTDWQLSLKEPLAQMGLQSLFEPSTDLVEIAGGTGWKVEDVLHRAVIEVDEGGIKASAATAVLMAGTALPLEDPHQLTFNRPFGYVVYEVESRTPVFAGVVNDPRG